MCFQAIIAINKYRGTDLTPTQLAVLKEIASYYNKELSNPLYPSIKALCLKTRYGHSTIERSLKHLRDNNFLIVLVPADKGRQRPTFYHLNFDKLKSDESYKLPVKPVDNHVNKPVNNLTTSPTKMGLHPSLRLTTIVSPSPTVGDDQIPCRSININNHNNGDYKKLLYTLSPNQVLEKFNVDSQSISRWLRDYGSERICHEISCMSEISFQIGNPGAWIRQRLEGGSLRYGSTTDRCVELKIGGF